MIITNKTGLPAPFVRMAQSDYEPTPKRYSATTLLKSVREILLKRRHDAAIEQDCADMTWLLFGKAVHRILEEYGTGENEFTEEKLTVELENGYTVSGIIDFYDMAKGELVDYKTASVWKVIHKDFDDWYKQGLIYAWLLWQNGLSCKKATFYAILKDHNVQKAKYETGYPKLPVQKVEFRITEDDLEYIEVFIREKIEMLRLYEGAPDDELPLCTKEERWNDGVKYAVMKKGRKTALRVLDSLEEADRWMEKNGGDLVEVREGTDKKCLDYCLCCTKCFYWKMLQNKEN